MHQAHNQASNLKRCSRLVILPDYQGIGLGVKFISIIAGCYTSQKFQFSIVTSAKNMIAALSRSSEWHMTRYDKGKDMGSKSTIKYDAERVKCKTATFKYIGKEGKIWRKSADLEKKLMKRSL